MNVVRPEPFVTDASGEDVCGVESCCARREEKLKADS